MNCAKGSTVSDELESLRSVRALLLPVWRKFSFRLPFCPNCQPTCRSLRRGFHFTARHTSLSQTFISSGCVVLCVCVCILNLIAEHAFLRAVGAHSLRSPLLHALCVLRTTLQARSLWWVSSVVGQDELEWGQELSVQQIQAQHSRHWPLLLALSASSSSFFVSSSSPIRIS